SSCFAFDGGDADLGSSGPLCLDGSGVTPSHLVVAMGKGGYGYLLDRSNLGGINDGVDSTQIANSHITQAATTYRTAQGTYVAFRQSSSRLATFRITATSPPTIDFPAWGVNQNGCGSPFMTSTDGTNNMIVWTVGTGTNGDQRLHGYAGHTG